MKLSTLSALLLLVACDVGEFDPTEESDELIAAGQDPCKDPGVRKKANWLR